MMVLGIFIALEVAVIGFFVICLFVCECIKRHTFEEFIDNFNSGDDADDTVLGSDAEGQKTTGV